MIYKTRTLIIPILLLATLCLAACQPGPNQNTGKIQVVAVESFLADLTQNVAGDRVNVDSLIPLGVDPHAFEPTPQDVARISQSNLLVINGGGLEAWLAETLDNAGGQRLVVVASDGLSTRTPGAGEVSDEHEEGDPHFWLNPLNAIQYIENIRDGLTQVDPEGKDVYTANAAAYIDQLKQLDGWIEEQVSVIPPDKRLMVTNHESFGYYADRYGFRVIGTILPGVSSEASPSAQQLAGLVDTIKNSGVKVIFLETGANPQLADQIATETGVKVVTDLYTHSMSAPGGPAPTYLEMMRYNTRAIVDALK